MLVYQRVYRSLSIAAFGKKCPLGHGYTSYPDDQGDVRQQLGGQDLLSFRCYLALLLMWWCKDEDADKDVNW